VKSSMGRNVRRGSSDVRRKACPAVFERIEGRLLLSAGGADLAAVVAVPQLDATPCVTNAFPYGLTPAKVRHAYGFDQITFVNALGRTVVGDGSGQTIAIVDAYDDPNMAADLKVFDATFGLSDYDSKGLFALTTVKMSSRMSVNSGWAMETALDVEWAHAIAPKAHILLVEAASASFTDLFAAVDYAARQPNVAAVSMSWGAGEFSSESSYDNHFKTPTGHVGGGVTFVAASGDSGKGGLYPAMSPNVVSVGGTQLSVDVTGNYFGESAWSGSGGGISPYEGKPSYQASVKQSTSKRTGPDVAYDGAPSSGFAVYDTVAYSGKTGWWQVGGTSAGAPQWAALVAVVDQGRALAGKAGLDGRTQMLPALYNLSAADFHDITSGSNGYAAATGYDLVTGRGTPVASLVVRDLVTASATGTLTVAQATVRAAAPAVSSRFAKASGVAPGRAAMVQAVCAVASDSAAAPAGAQGVMAAMAQSVSLQESAGDAAPASDTRDAVGDAVTDRSQVSTPSIFDLGVDVLASIRPLSLLAA
jgi:subtilase family serine protease